MGIVENIQRRKNAVSSLLRQGWEFSKLLPDNAPGQDEIFTPEAPTYLQNGERAAVVYANGQIEFYTPVYKPRPPYNGPPMFD